MPEGFAVVVMSLSTSDGTVLATVYYILTALVLMLISVPGRGRIVFSLCTGILLLYFKSIFLVLCLLKTVFVTGYYMHYCLR